MAERIDPASLHCHPGKLLVEITEVLGGIKRGLFHLPQDHGRKDTAIGRVLNLGDSPRLSHFFHPHMRAADVKESEVQWPEGFHGVQEGHFVAFPRDVPRVFVWKGDDGEDRRYAVLHLHELLFHFTEAEVEVVPWPMPNR